MNTVYLRNWIWKVRYRSKRHLERLRLAWALALNRLTVSQGRDLLYLSEQAGHMHGLEYLTVERVLEQIEERFGEDARFRHLAEQACARVSSKWESAGHLSGAAQDRAVDIFIDYSRSEGVKLVDQWEETNV